MRLDPAIIQQQISNLLLQLPELAEDDQLRADMIEGETDTFDFLRQIERMRQDASALAGAVAGNIAELELRQQRFERREKAMRDLMFKIMTSADMRKAELPEATLSIRAGQRKLVGDPDPAVLPDQFVRVKRDADRAAIKKALEDGSVIPGCELTNGEPSLSVRVK